MRPRFFELLYKEMKKDDRIWLLVGDLGYGGADKIRDDFPNRFINTGSAEFSMVGIAIGLALEGKIPFCYTITPFFYRAFEILRTYVDYENIPVKLVGSGRDTDYEHDGYSHNAEDVKKVMGTLPNIVQYWPKTKEDISVISLVFNSKPSFISLGRG
uniref:Putative transketolase domain containing protein n=1 Tax=viral metagenome TaxID=1070528 RepID=A0A6M3J0Z6_9ZZZZ